MGMITALFDNSIQSCEEAFGVADCTSELMKEAIREWFSLYFASKKTDKEDPCMQIPFTVIQKLTKTAFGEYATACEDQFVENAVLKKLNKQKKKAFQMAMIGGLCYIKPFPMGNRFSFSIVNRNNMLVFGKDADGMPVDIGTAERTAVNRRYYTLLERRTVDARGLLTIRNMLYRSDNEASLGTLTSLSELPKYAGLVPEYTFPRPLSSPIGMVPLMTPLTNNVDGSNDPVSVYSPAVGLIHNININEAQINGEFDRGRSRIIASKDLLKKDKNGRSSFDETLFVGLDDDPENIGVNIFSPAFREQSYLARKQDYLRAVETAIGLKRGLISEVEAVERTATEITSSAGDYNLTIIDFQEAWEDALKDAVKLCGELGVLYKVAGAHEIADDDVVTVDWGNGILYDEDKTWADYKDMAASGLIKPEIALGWRFGMPTDTPEVLAAIREKYMPGAEDLTEDDDADE